MPAKAQGFECGMLLQNQAFFVREQVAVLRFADAYDLLHPTSGQVLGLAQEKPKLKWLRLLVKKQMLPTEVVVLESDQQSVALRLEKGWSFFTSKLAVFDAQGRKLGSLRNKLFSLSGKILVEDADERPIGEFSGGVFSWTRQLKDPAGVVIGTMDKKWAGIGKELFTSADNYHLEVAPEFAGQPAKVALLLAACLAYDVIFAEN
ncbi:MAG: hypothetical protein RLZZ178_781 [Verrucomicrobiota bacterium]